MRLQPHDKRRYTIFPLPTDGIGVIEITDEQHQGLLNRTHCFSDDLTAVIPWVKTADELVEENSAERKAYLLSEITRLKSQLAATDYKAIKYAEGALTAEEYEPDRASREMLREQINRYEAED